MARKYWTFRGLTAKSSFLAVVSIALAAAGVPKGSTAATLSMVSQLDRVNEPYPSTRSNAVDGPAGANSMTGSQLIRLVWDFRRGAGPTRQSLFGGSFETYAGGTVQVVALDGTPMFNLGSFTVINFSEYDALALASDTGDGVFIFRDPDYATVTRQKLGALVAPLIANANTQLSDFFFRSTEDQVSRINATVGDLVPTAEAPLPLPALLLGTVLGALGLMRVVRRAA